MNAMREVDDYVDLLLGTGAPVPAAVTGEGPALAPAVAPLVPAAPPSAVAQARRAVAPAASAQVEAEAAADVPAHGERRRRRGERTARWLRLRCGAQAYALELLKIREVVRPMPLLSLRGAVPSVAGVMNLRGQVVPVIDLGVQLGESAAADTGSTRIIVLEERGEVLGLRVCSVEDVVVINDAQVEDTHVSRLAPVGDRRIHGIARIGRDVMLLLDASRLIEMPLRPH
ncbi:purine-binding chemotaxis protein CheW [Luteimonas yindakuii]|uniref:Chemotaxis protein CheW n=1 Tax=Luteimonas yindakuii TaxID=2565782 RepID=A0A4Z1RB05_9GAMM|nr:chemotaxis protein CheW [Luteimonas yindakuii]TKS53948.1 purine-binding chemotaxis protein CheW [Luteimonas yindakuii]